MVWLQKERFLAHTYSKLSLRNQDHLQLQSISMIMPTLLIFLQMCILLPLLIHVIYIHNILQIVLIVWLLHLRLAPSMKSAKYDEAHNVVILPIIYRVLHLLFCIVSFCIRKVFVVMMGVFSHVYIHEGFVFKNQNEYYFMISDFGIVVL